MKNNLKTVIQSDTFRQSSLASFSTVVNGLLGVAFYPLVARMLDVKDFGIFSVSVLAMTLVADIANVGTDTGIVRFVGKYLTSDRERAYKYLKFALEIKFIVGIIVICLGWIVMPLVATNILQRVELIAPLRLALVGSFSVLLYSFSTSVLQSLQKFGVWSALNISLNSFRIIAFVLVALLGLLSVHSTIVIYALVPLTGFFISFFYLPKFWKVQEHRSVAREFLHYNKFVAVFILLAAFSSRLDSFLATKLLSLESLGIYSAAVSLAAVGPQIVSAIATVVAPKLAGFDSKETLLRYLKKLQLFLIILGVLGFIFGSLLGSILIPAIFGIKFLASIEPFVILLAAQVAFLISIPVHTAIIYYYAKPSVFVVVTFIHLLVVYFLGTYLITTNGIVGAALAVLVGSIFNLIIPSVWFLRKVANE